MERIKVALCGAAGRMGRTLIRMLVNEPGLELSLAVEAPHTPLEGRDAGEIAGVGRIGLPIRGAEKLEELLAEVKPDVLVDFTVPQACVENVKKACARGVDVVVGTTGLTPQQAREIEEAVRKAGVRAVVSPNMSLGVNLLFNLLERTCARLKDYDVEIVEAHHATKKDAPSGTALKMAGIIEQIAGKKPKIHSIRAGEIVGDHTVIFAGPGERLEITHRAQGREAFASGVIRVLKLLRERGKPGEVLSTEEIFS